MPPKKNNVSNAAKKQQNAINQAAQQAAQQAVSKVTKQQKSKPKAKGSGKMGCPYPVLSVHNPRDVPCLTPSGKATSIQVESRINYTSGAYSALYVFTNMGNSPMYGVSIDNQATPSRGLYFHSQYSLQNAAISGGPVSGRAMKTTIDIRNTTPSGAVGGGTVYILELDARFSTPVSFSTLSQGQVNTLMTNIRSAPGVKVLTGSDLSHGRTYSCRVADFKDYEDFGMWDYGGAGSVSDVVFDYGAGQVALPRPMTTVALLIDNYSGTATYPANTYDVRVISKYYVRYSPEALPYTMQKEMPLASAAQVARIYKGADFPPASMAV